MIEFGSTEFVQAASTLKTNGQGQVRSISNLSWHFTPNVGKTKLFPKVLENSGVKTKNVWLEKYSIEMTPLGYVNTIQLITTSLR